MGGIGSGGARRGAGRKPEGKERVTLCLPDWLLRMARHESHHQQRSLSAYLSEVMEKGMER